MSEQIPEGYFRTHLDDGPRYLPIRKKQKDA